MLSWSASSRGEPLHLLGPTQMWLRGLGELDEVPEMRLPGLVRLTRFGEPVSGVLPDRGQHPIARGSRPH